MTLLLRISNPTDMKTPDIIKRLLATAKISQNKLAEIMDTRKATVSNYVNGHQDIKLNVFLDACEKLEIDPKSIL